MKAARRTGLTAPLLALLLSAGADALQGPLHEEPAGDDVAVSSSPRPVDHALDWLREQRDRLADDLERLHARLLERARVEAPELAERLEREPPRALPRGYAMLPKVLPDEPLRSIELRETSYSVEFSTRAYTLAFRDAAILADRAEADPALELEHAADEYERIRARLENLDDNLAYHEFWQPELVRHRAFFDGRNEVLFDVREMRAMRESGAATERLARLEREVRAAVAPFRPTPGLEVEERADGTRVLPVRVVTDVQDDAFLATFEGAVRAAWCDAEAVREARFCVELELERVDPAELYPEGPPARGELLDLEDHLRRFGEGRLVLTTGAESTNSMVGRYVQLGVRDVKPRVLAHEFGHLLGFADGYLRGYEGDPDGPYGARLIEVTGILDDLMGSPARGRTSSAMIQQLLNAYGG